MCNFPKTQTAHDLIFSFAMESSQKIVPQARCTKSYEQGGLGAISIGKG